MLFKAGGPYPLRQDAVHSVFEPIGQASAWSCWLPDYGLIGWRYGYINNAEFPRYCIAQYDGTIYLRNSQLADMGEIFFSRRNKALTKSITSPPLTDPVTGLTGVGCYVLDPLTGARGALACIAPNDAHATRVIEWDDYNLIYSSGYGLYRTSMGNGTRTYNSTLLYTIPSPYYSTDVSISEGSSNTIWLCTGAGYAIEFDLLTDTPGRIFVIPATINTVLTLTNWWFDNFLNVFIAFYKDTTNATPLNVPQLVVYAAETIPASLSNPVATPSPKQGFSSVITTTLSGDHSEPCPGLPIDWSITAGGGTVDPAQSLTDENGLATTRYYAPVSSAGTLTIQASFTS